jgi:hypothetical protein
MNYLLDMPTTCSSSHEMQGEEEEETVAEKNSDVMSGCQLLSTLLVVVVVHVMLPKMIVFDTLPPFYKRKSCHTLALRSIVKPKKVSLWDMLFISC